MNDSSLPSFSPLSDAQEAQLRSIVDDALAKRPIVQLTIQVLPGSSPEEIVSTIRSIVSNFYDLPAPSDGKP